MKRNSLLKYAFIISLSLTPIIWFFKRPGILINGVDTNFPLNPEVWFVRRLFVWTNVGNLGSDFSASTAGTFFHFLQFFPFKLNFPLQTIEIINLVFWFGLIIFGSWFFAKLIFPKKTFPQLIFVCLYSLNIYLFNSFENVKVANLSLVASIPLALSVLILSRRNKIKRSTSLLLSFAIGIILAGSGINPSYIISFFIILGIYLLSEILINITKPKEIFEIIKDFSIASLGFISVNLFWIIPSVFFILKNISASNSITSIGFSNWVDSLSGHTSFINLLRMLGAWDWYSIDSATGLPLYIPYASKYFNNILFIGFSYLIPSLAFMAFIFRKKIFQGLYLFFGISLVLGLFLTAGTHPPTGGLFSFLGRHLPFFSLFRSPWYIFAPFVGLSIAGLVGIFVNHLQEVIPNKIIFYMGSIILIVGTLVYSYPLILGRIFRPNFNGSFYVKFPQYIFDTQKYLTESGDGRILSYPDDNIERFNWGYSGVDSILNLFSDKEVVFTPLNDTGTPISQDISGIYSSIKKGEIIKANSLANILGIDKIFDKNDQISFAPELPSSITSNKIASFGKWNFYQFPSLNPRATIYSANSLFTSISDNDTSGNLSLMANGEILVNPKDSVLSKLDINNNLGSIVKAANSQQKDISMYEFNPYDLSFKTTQRNIDNVKYIFELPTQGNFLPILENHQLDLFGIITQNKVSGTLDGININLNIDHTDNSYIYFSSIYLKSGKHELIIPLQNKNLITENNYSTVENANFNLVSGTFSILNKGDRDAFFSFKLSNYDPYSTYVVSVDSKYDYGKSPEIYAIQAGEKITYKSQQEVLPIFPEFGGYNFYFTPAEIPSTAEIHLIAPFTRDPQGTKVEFKNLKVYKLFTNNLYFRNNPTSKIDTAKVTFKKESPVLYEGEVSNSSGPQIIVFNENYSPQWELKVDGINSKIFHFSANTFSNAWYVNGPIGNYKFTIYYKPQTYQNLGRVFGLLSVTIGTLWFVSEHKKKNAKK